MIVIKVAIHSTNVWPGSPCEVRPIDQPAVANLAVAYKYEGWQRHKNLERALTPTFVVAPNLVGGHLEHERATRTQIDIHNFSTSDQRYLVTYSSSNWLPINDYSTKEGCCFEHTFSAKPTLRNLKQDLTNYVELDFNWWRIRRAGYIFQHTIV